MKISKYMKDKRLAIVIRCIFLAMFLAILVLFDTPNALCILFAVCYVLIESLLFIWDFFRRRRFYNMLLHNTAQLDKKYLVLETLEQPSFYDGQLMCQSLYEINKSMCENVNHFKKGMVDFKEYIEMWVHEVKIPLASLRLMCHNHKNEIDKKYVEQIRRIDNYTEQVLYYVRSEHTEKDFLIKEVELEKLIPKVALHQKEDLLDSKIELLVDHNNAVVLTDGKWLEFVLNQIINNAIKYRDSKKQSYIRITVEEVPERFVLHIKDNGIGIPESDLSRVFDKSFTGENGRLQAKSTGMGLYIAKKLCKSLGHALSIASKQGEYTTVSIAFAKNDYYKM